MASEREWWEVLREDQARCRSCPPSSPQSLSTSLRPHHNLTSSLSLLSKLTFRLKYSTLFWEYFINIPKIIVKYFKKIIKIFKYLQKLSLSIFLGSGAGQIVLGCAGLSNREFWWQLVNRTDLGLLSVLSRASQRESQSQLNWWRSEVPSRWSGNWSNFMHLIPIILNFISTLVLFDPKRVLSSNVQ